MSYITLNLPDTFVLNFIDMIQKNLFLLEYMVLQRIEKDTIRLEAIRSIGNLLEEGELDLSAIIIDDASRLIKELALIKGRSLSYSENELVEEIIQISKDL